MIAFTRADHSDSFAVSTDSDLMLDLGLSQAEFRSTVIKVDTFSYLRRAWFWQKQWNGLYWGGGVKA
ncbi:hypothetical protein PM082_017033 [Marasmius tenuissimus]|nr:hypothetical protein PM082_017033 [Marasmius tenuissimus]